MLAKSCRVDRESTAAESRMKSQPCTIEPGVIAHPQPLVSLVVPSLISAFHPPLNRSLAFPTGLATYYLVVPLHLKD